jgi:hypothetical protein
LARLKREVVYNTKDDLQKEIERKQRYLGFLMSRGLCKGNWENFQNQIYDLMGEYNRKYAVCHTAALLPGSIVSQKFLNVLERYKLSDGNFLS